ncbi:N-acetylglucosamine-6-phosphate deacetylase [Microvirga zambiensis]|uniref:N-acetylglucosamine-6-phosphate deacetylase n=1 Tax=Microvirga zambiensis TaxID=1402137 RepID=UPI00191C9CB4|nr:N-acetylglucosamine-6-phosphate deacetylase [Microvirga zambiensis]
MRTSGLFDLQVNGFAGIDFNSETIDADALDHALEAMLATGVATCLPTLITAPDDVLEARFAALDRAVAQSRLGPLMVPGYHLEGPFLNPGDGYAGCHPPGAMRAPDPTLIERLNRILARPILLVTIAPELAGSETFIRAVTAESVVAIGHSAAGSATVAAAADAGARLSTHLGNGLPQVLPKLDNPLFAQLAEDRLSASFIADGIHLPPHALKTLLRAKGSDRAILVSDAVSAAAAPPGLYPFAGMMVEHASDGSVRLPGSAYLAGSALVLDRAVRNLVGWGLATAGEAVSMASDNPRRLMATAIAALAADLPDSEILWSDDLYPLAVRVGDIERRYA